MELAELSAEALRVRALAAEFTATMQEIETAIGSDQNGSGS